ncbi:MAG: PilZ domain-containing protein [Desulfobacterales bacterium]|jgi:hypothetical protein
MTNKNSKISITEVHDRISKIIPKLSEMQARNLLIILEKWHQSNFTEKRKYFRKSSLITAHFSAQNFTWTDTIQDLSVSGLFIETRIPFFVGDELSMTFSLTDAENPIKITGKIVRVDSNGIGVQFEELLPDI